MAYYRTLASLVLVGAANSLTSIAASQINPAPVTAAKPVVVADAQQLMAMGNAMADLGRYTEAITAYSLALEQDPDNGLILANRALAYAWINRVAEASKDLKAAEGKLPASAVLHRVRAIIANRGSDQDTELSELTKSLALEPTNNFALSFRAHIYQERGLYEAAIADADAYIRARPDEPEAYELKAKLLGGQRQWPLALAQASMVALRFSREPRALASAATIYRNAGKRAQALEVIGRALSLDGGAFYLWERRAGLRQWNDFDGRKRDLETALELAPNDMGIVAKLGLLAVDQQHWSVANARFTQILDQEPNDFLVRAYRAMASVKLQNATAAEGDFKAAFDTASGAGDFSRICFALAAHGVALDRAKTSCDRAIATDPDRPSYRTNRGLLRLRTGALDGAIADYDLSIASDPNDAEAYYGRAIARFRTGQREEAEQDRLTALAIDPTIAEDFESRQMTDLTTTR